MISNVLLSSRIATTLSCYERVFFIDPLLCTCQPCSEIFNHATSRISPTSIRTQGPCEARGTELRLGMNDSMPLYRAGFFLESSVETRYLSVSETSREMISMQVTACIFFPSGLALRRLRASWSIIVP